MRSPGNADSTGAAAFAEVAERLIHEAVVVDGLWSARCRPRLGTTVPLARLRRQVTCVDCVDMANRGVIGPIASGGSAACGQTNDDERKW